jgi:c-di-GMP-binding flagellar brake protein YcgR
MFLDTLPAPLDEADGSDAWADFRVSSPAEILAYLKPLLESALPFGISAPSGAAFTTCLWSIDHARNTLSFAADGPSQPIQAIVQAGTAVAVAYDDHIKFQLPLTDLVLVQGQQAASLQCSIPKELYRFQRRNSFRAKPPGRGGPTLRLRHPANPSLVMALRVLDLSTGGCGLQLPPDAPPIAEGSRITGARLELDVDVRLALGLEVRRVSEMLDAQGQPVGIRLSCEWQGQNGQAERALQHYVDNLQKRRRMLAMRDG